MAAIFYTLATLKSRINDKFADKERGATAIEYALIVGLVSIGLVVAMMAIGITDITTSIKTWLGLANAKIPTTL